MQTGLANRTKFLNFHVWETNVPRTLAAEQGIPRGTSSDALINFLPKDNVTRFRDGIARSRSVTSKGRTVSFHTIA